MIEAMVACPACGTRRRVGAATGPDSHGALRATVREPVRVRAPTDKAATAGDWPPWKIGGLVCAASVAFALPIVYGLVQRGESVPAPAASVAPQVDIARLQREATAAAQAAEAAAAEAAAKRRAGELAEARTRFTSVTTKEREEGVRTCVVASTCRQDMLDTIVATGKTDKERAHLGAVAFAASAREVANLAEDGTSITLAPAAGISTMLRQQGTGFLDELGKTTIAEAQKDPAANRGKLVRVSGSVVSIHKDGDFFEGTLAVGGGRFVYFLTPLPTPGVFQGTWVSYRGVFMQEYAYSNVSGGQTRSLLIVGAFAPVQSEDD